MIASVQDITTRPDAGMLTIIKRSLAEAIREIHGIAKFCRDLQVVDTNYAYDSSQLFVASFPERYRQIHRPVLEYSDGTIIEDLEAQVLGIPTRWEAPLSQYYRILGSGINIYYQGQPSRILLEYLQYPIINLTTNTTDSWIAEIDDTAIVYLAAAKVFHATGDDAAVRTYQQLAELQKPALLRNFEAI